MLCAFGAFKIAITLNVAWRGVLGADGPAYAFVICDAKKSRCFASAHPTAALHRSEDATPRINATSAYSSSAAKRFNPAGGV